MIMSPANVYCLAIASSLTTSYHSKFIMYRSLDAKSTLKTKMPQTPSLTPPGSPAKAAFDGLVTNPIQQNGMAPALESQIDDSRTGNEGFRRPAVVGNDRDIGRNWRRENSAAGSQISISRSILDSSWAYGFQREEGCYTQLVPADSLPPLAGLVPSVLSRQGLIILPVPSIKDAEELKEVTSPTSDGSASQASPTDRKVQGQIDSIISQSSNTSPHRTPSTRGPRRSSSIKSPMASTKPDKIYCDMWLFKGICGFTQQGCKYKHEMPMDRATQAQVGLNAGLPEWWKRNNAIELNSSPATKTLSSSRTHAASGGISTATHPVMHTRERAVSSPTGPLYAPAPMQSPTLDEHLFSAAPGNLLKSPDSNLGVKTPPSTMLAAKPTPLIPIITSPDANFCAPPAMQPVPKDTGRNPQPFINPRNHRAAAPPLPHNHRQFQTQPQMQQSSSPFQRNLSTHPKSTSQDHSRAHIRTQPQAGSRTGSRPRWQQVQPFPPPTTPPSNSPSTGVTQGRRQDLPRGAVMQRLGAVGGKGSPGSKDLPGGGGVSLQSRNMFESLFVAGEVGEKGI